MASSEGVIPAVTQTNPEQEVESGRQVLGRYTVLGKLTQGGMAEVYLAQQKGPAGYTKLVVVKRVRPNLANDKDFVAMFVNEARLAALINHPNVVQIFDLGQDGKDWFLAMEFLDGRDMLQIGRACRAHNKAVPFDVTARIIADACAGLEHAHRLVGADGKPLNLVHRDMSPENLLITFEGQIKVLDFGIAKARDNAFRTQAGQIKGKLGYVAPEAILGKELDGRADIFAIGATLYLFLCGRPAFTGSNPMEIFEKSLQPPEAPSKINPRVPGMLEEICVKCLAQDPKRRYGSAGELRGALEGYLGSTKRPLGPAQLSQFMQILFPPDKDPVRQKIDSLIAAGEALGFEGGPTNLVPDKPSQETGNGGSASVDLYSDDDDSTAVVPPEERPDRQQLDATAPPPSQPPMDATARGPAFRSVELAGQFEPPNTASAEATVNRQPFSSASDGPPLSADEDQHELTVELSPDLLSELRESASREGASRASPPSAAPKPVSGEGISDSMEEPTLGLGDLHVDNSADAVLDATTPALRAELPRSAPASPVVSQDDDSFLEESAEDFSIEDSIEAVLSGPASAPPPPPASTGEHVQFGLQPVDSEPTHAGVDPSSMSASDLELAPVEASLEEEPYELGVPPAEPTAAFENATLPAEAPREIRYVPASLGARLFMLVAGMAVGAFVLFAALYVTGDLELIQRRLGVSVVAK